MGKSGGLRNYGIIVRRVNKVGKDRMIARNTNNLLEVVVTKFK